MCWIQLDICFPHFVSCPQLIYSQMLLAFLCTQEYWWLMSPSMSGHFWRAAYKLRRPFPVHISPWGLSSTAEGLDVIPYSISSFGQILQLVQGHTGQQSASELSAVSPYCVICKLVETTLHCLLHLTQKYVKQNLPDCPFSLCCSNLDLCIVWVMMSYYSQSKWIPHYSSVITAPCSARLSDFSFRQTQKLL